MAPPHTTDVAEQTLLQVLGTRRLPLPRISKIFAGRQEISPANTSGGSQRPDRQFHMRSTALAVPESGARDPRRKMRQALNRITVAPGRSPRGRSPAATVSGRLGLQDLVSSPEAIAVRRGGTCRQRPFRCKARRRSSPLLLLHYAPEIVPAPVMQLSPLNVPIGQSRRRAPQPNVQANRYRRSAVDST